MRRFSERRHFGCAIENLTFLSPHLSPHLLHISAALAPLAALNLANMTSFLRSSPPPPPAEPKKRVRAFFCFVSILLVSCAPHISSHHPRFLFFWFCFSRRLARHSQTSYLSDRPAFDDAQCSFSFVFWPSAFFRASFHTNRDI